MALTTQTTRRLLRLTTLSFLLASGVLAWRAFCEPSFSDLASSEISVAAPRVRPSERNARPLEDFAPLLTRAFGAPLYDLASEQDTAGTNDPAIDEETYLPPVPMPTSENLAAENAKAAPKKPRLRPESTGLRLMGTLIEDAGSVAIISTLGDGVQLAKVGETIRTNAGDSRVHDIRLDQVVLSIEGDLVTLKVPR